MEWLFMLLGYLALLWVLGMALLVWFAVGMSRARRFPKPANYTATQAPTTDKEQP